MEENDLKRDRERERRKMERGISREKGGFHGSQRVSPEQVNLVLLLLVVLVVPGDLVLDLAAVLSGGRLVEAGGPDRPAGRLVVGHSGLLDRRCPTPGLLATQPVHIQRPATHLRLLNPLT